MRRVGGWAFYFFFLRLAARRFISAERSSAVMAAQAFSPPFLPSALKNCRVNFFFAILRSLLAESPALRKRQRASIDLQTPSVVLFAHQADQNEESLRRST